jgi:hypothetical protein
VTGDNLPSLFSRLGSKLNANVGPGWVKYEYNGAFWDLNDGIWAISCMSSKLITVPLQQKQITRYSHGVSLLLRPPHLRRSSSSMIHSSRCLLHQPTKTSRTTYSAPKSRAGPRLLPIDRINRARQILTLPLQYHSYRVLLIAAHDPEPCYKDRTQSLVVHVAYDPPNQGARERGESHLMMTKTTIMTGEVVGCRRKRKRFQNINGISSNFTARMGTEW